MVFYKDILFRLCYNETLSWLILFLYVLYTKFCTEKTFKKGEKGMHITFEFGMYGICVLVLITIYLDYLFP